MSGSGTAPLPPPQKEKFLNLQKRRDWKHLLQPLKRGQHLRYIVLPIGLREDPQTRAVPLAQLAAANFYPPTFSILSS